MYSWASAFSVSSFVSLFSRNVTFQAFVFSYLHFNLLCFGCKSTTTLPFSPNTLGDTGKGNMSGKDESPAGDLFFLLSGKKSFYSSWASGCLPNRVQSRLLKNTTICQMCQKQFYVHIISAWIFFARWPTKKIPKLSNKKTILKNKLSSFLLFWGWGA